VNIWGMFQIYDDFLDEEGSPKLLSAANLCLRELTTIFNEILPKETGFAEFSKKILDTIDSANTWEVSHCRINSKKRAKLRISSIPDYGDLSQLAEKSLGHALGPIAILFSLGYKETSPEVKNLMNFFKQYIIARQLNDDAHDWEEDFTNGQVNAVGAMILQSVKSKKGKNLTIEELQQVFWYDVAPVVCKKMLDLVAAARKSLLLTRIVKDTTILDQLLLSIEKSANVTLWERKETLQFLRTYGQK